MSKPWKNREGYSDPTAYEGMKPVIREDVEREKRLNTLIFVLKYIIRLAGFELLNRIERPADGEGIQMMDLENRVLTMVKTYFPETPENVQVQVGAFLTAECWNLINEAIFDIRKDYEKMMKKRMERNTNEIK